MARMLSILLILIYSFSATGATVHLHYCCGTPQHVVTQDEQKQQGVGCQMCLKHHEKQKSDSCFDGADETDHSCDTDGASLGHCKNIKIEAKKTTEEHLPSGDQNPVKIYPLELLVISLAHVMMLPQDVHNAIVPVNIGLPETSIPLFIQHCTFRI